MRKRRQVELFSISFLDLLSGALGAVIILYVAIPKNQLKVDTPLKDTTHQEKTIAQLMKENQELKEKVQSLQLQIETKTQAPAQGISDISIGFKFKGKNLLFLIDTSFSMIDEDRLAQVQAGLKMLITSLPPEYKIDIVQFPSGERAPFKSMWGDIHETSQDNKIEALEFIYSLRPKGGTPTRETLAFALDNYDTITDIVLLTDGAPTLHNSNQQDSVQEILSEVRDRNNSRVQINCIGVGKNFLKDKDSARYKFLSQLASENKGFFVGF